MKRLPISLKAFLILMLSTFILGGIPFWTGEKTGTLFLQLFTSVALAYYFHRKISCRINTVKNALAKLVETGYSGRIDIDGDDEISDIAIAFNAMADQIKNQHSSLLEDEELLLRTQEIADLGSWELYFPTRTLVWSDQAYRIFGYASGEVSPSREIYENTLHPDDKERVNDCFFASIKSQKGEAAIEHRIIQHNTGQVRYVIQKFVHTKDDKGNLLHTLGMIQDITNRKVMEREILASAQHLQFYHEHTHLGFIEWDQDAKIIGWNKAAEGIFGYSFAEATCEGFIQNILEEGIDVDDESIWGELELQHGGITSVDINRTKNGRNIRCEWHKSPLRDEAGKLSGAAAIVLDVTAEYQVQQSLLKKEQEQNEILNSMVDGVVSVDDSGAILTFNKSAEKIFAYGIQEVIGENLSSLMSEKSAQEFVDYQLAYAEPTGVEFISELEIEGRRKDGSLFPLRISVAELPSTADGRKRFIGCFSDLTESKQQLELIRRTQKLDALGTLTGGIAHDYNNLLGVILGYAELLETMLARQPEILKYVQTIRQASERGAKLTHNLLAFSRNKPSKAEAININMLLHDGQHMLEKSLTVRIKLTYELVGDLWDVSLDASDLEDAVLNMSINALHAMPEGGELVIKTSNKNIMHREAQRLGLKVGAYVLLSLKDTGYGMDKATQDKIFEPFYSTKGEKGTGLGLSQVYGFVERSGGGIRVSSKLGEGTDMELYFPRHAMALESKPESDKAVSVDGLGGTESILVVDDELSLLELTREILTTQGYQVFSAGSVDQALDILKIERVDLLFSDVVMPEKDGYELASIVQEKYPQVKIQLTSGYNDDRHINMSKGDLYQNLLPKPYHAKTLLSKIRELLAA